jgi:hypothetical protein
MNNDLCIIFAVEGNQLLRDIRRVSVKTCCPATEYLYAPWHLSKFVYDFRTGLSTFSGAPKVLSGALTCSETFHNHSHGTPVPVISDPSYSCTSHQRSRLLLNQLSEIPVTLIGGHNALLESDSLLKLTLLSLHSTSSQTLLEASRD